MKVYLIGFLYDDFRTEGFEILRIASTIEKAKILLEDLIEENPNGFNKMGYEIREMEVDNAEPVGEVRHKECILDGIKFLRDEVLPYKVVREEKKIRMDRDIIIVWNSYDAAYIILNGLWLNPGGIEYGYEMGEVLISLFNNLKYNYNKPLVIDIYQDDVDFSEEELEKLYDRKEFCTDDELQVLNDTEDVTQFVNKIKENLWLEKKEE